MRDKELKAGRRLVWKEEKRSRGEGQEQEWEMNLANSMRVPVSRALRQWELFQNVKLRWKCVIEKLVWWQEVCRVAGWERLTKGVGLGQELGAAMQIEGTTRWTKCQHR